MTDSSGAPKPNRIDNTQIATSSSDEIAAVQTSSIESEPATGHAITLQPNGVPPLPTYERRVDYLPMPAHHDQVNSPVLVIEHRHIEPTPIGAPASSSPAAAPWSLSQLLSVLGIMAIIAMIGSALGFDHGRGVEPTYAARSELIYFLEDAVPDGFLREDRRILTQLVTMESETILQPIAAEFSTTVKDLRDAIEIEVVDLSEVIRLDVEHADPARALAINKAVLAAYQEQTERTFIRTDSSPLFVARERLIAELQIVDEQSREVQLAETEDVELRIVEESLSRELEIATQRSQNLSSIADGLLVETNNFDDTSSINSQIDAANQTIAALEAELLVVRTEREELQQSLRNIEEEFAYQGDAARQQDVGLSVREESIRTRITTAAERVRRLEAVRAEALLNNQVQTSSAPVNDRLAATQQTIGELESQLLNVRTKRTQVAQQAAALPSLTRKVERLEAELDLIETKLGDVAFIEQAPSPIEILTAPVVLDEPVGSPQIQWAAIGFLASIPLAVLAAAALRSRQRRKP